MVSKKLLDKTRINKTDKVYGQEWPTADEIAEQQRIKAEIDLENSMRGPVNCPDRRGMPGAIRVVRTSMLPSGIGIVKGN